MIERVVIVHDAFGMPTGSYAWVETADPDMAELLATGHIAPAPVPPPAPKVLPIAEVTPMCRYCLRPIDDPEDHQAARCVRV